MTALPTTIHTVAPSLPAHLWFQQHLPELTSRCHAVFCRLPEVEREEAIADVLAAIYQVIVRTYRRGRLDCLTPFWLVNFGARQYRSGRRFAGYSSSDVLSERARILGRVHVVSLDQARRPGTHRPHQPELEDLTIETVLTGMSREDQPFDNVRRQHDYPWIIHAEELGSKARQIFRACAEDWTTGVGERLTRELYVTPGRISQIKAQVGAALERHGYVSPPTRKAAARAQPRRSPRSKPSAPASS
ncbi:MAG: hypothetical protein WCI73_02335 [Phycisphaerae bacterium]